MGQVFSTLAAFGLMCVMIWLIVAAVDAYMSWGRK
jgi:hypothetical protein